MKILLISSAIPRNTTAGELILFRHLSQMSQLELAIASNKSINPLSHAEINLTRTIVLNSNRYIKRIEKTRFHCLIKSLQQYSRQIPPHTELKRYIKSSSPDIILTVAEGSFWPLAQKMAKDFKIPLVTFFHDWWPAQLKLYPWGRKRVEARFKQLALDSDMAFCVSLEMQKRLGNPQKSIVLYPMPEFSAEMHNNFSTERIIPFNVIYAGSLSFSNSLMLQNLIGKVSHYHNFGLSLYGPNPDWPYSILEVAKRNNIYKGFVSRSDLLSAFHSASALLVTVSFSESARCWAETCFPSKLVEYCKFGKPIIIWGPEYCCAVKWAKNGDRALCVTEENPDTLIDALEQLKSSPERQHYYAGKPLESAQAEFDPVILQKKFTTSIEKLISST